MCLFYQAAFAKKAIRICFAIFLANAFLFSFNIIFCSIARSFTFVLMHFSVPEKPIFMRNRVFKNKVFWRIKNKKHISSKLRKLQYASKVVTYWGAAGQN